MNIPLTVREKADLFDQLHEKSLESNKRKTEFEVFADDIFADNCYKDDGKCKYCNGPHH